MHFIWGLAYSPADDGNPRKLQHNYVLRTTDGFTLSGWPQTLVKDAEGHWPPLTLQAQYYPERDNSFSKVTKGLPPEEIFIGQNIKWEYSAQVERQSQSVTVGSYREFTENRHLRKISLLPVFITLTATDTRFDDHVYEDDGGNVLRSEQGKDYLRGNGGADRYVITGKTRREIVINNRDNSAEPAPDILEWAIPVNQVSLTLEGNNLLLSHRSAPDSHPVVRIRSFKVGPQFRHIALQDNEGKLHELSLNERGEAVLVNTLDGGTDDDVYVFDSIHVEGSLTDNGGMDTLRFTAQDMAIENLRLKREGDDLLIWFGGLDVFQLTVQNHYLPGQGIEVMEIGGEWLTGESIEQARLISEEIQQEWDELRKRLDEISASLTRGPQLSPGLQQPESQPGVTDEGAQLSVEQKNTFAVEKGKRILTGGRDADHFLLMDKSAPFYNIKKDEFSILNGAEGDDTVIARVKPRHERGYDINLHTGYLGYVKFNWRDDYDVNPDPVSVVDYTFAAKLYNIEHIVGHSETDDFLVGDNRSNIINGAGGDDYILSHGGDDFLTLEGGVAAGGAGVDTYRILKNNRNQDVSVVLREERNTQEISHVGSVQKSVSYLKL